MATINKDLVQAITDLGHTAFDVMIAGAPKVPGQTPTTEYRKQVRAFLRAIKPSDVTQSGIRQLWSRASSHLSPEVTVASIFMCMIIHV